MSKRIEAKSWLKTTVLAGVLITAVFAGSTAPVAANMLAIVDAEEDQNGYADHTVYFDSSGSCDPEGYIASNDRLFGDGITSSDVSVMHTYTLIGLSTVIFSEAHSDKTEGTDTTNVIIKDHPQQSSSLSGGVKVWIDLLTTDSDTYNVSETVYTTVIVVRGYDTLPYTWEGMLTLGIFDNAMNMVYTEEQQVNLTVGGMAKTYYFEFILDETGEYLVRATSMDITGSEVDMKELYITVIESPAVLEISKVKISGPDEVYTHTYYEWELQITVMNTGGSDALDVAVKDVLPAELKLLDYTLTQGTLKAVKKGKGKMGSTHLNCWTVGTLEPGKEANLTILISTIKNPAGKQEFTSPGTYILNDGASASGLDELIGEMISAGPTPPIAVTAIGDEENEDGLEDNSNNIESLDSIIYSEGHNTWWSPVTCVRNDYSGYSQYDCTRVLNSLIGLASKKKFY